MGVEKRGGGMIQKEKRVCGRFNNCRLLQSSREEFCEANENNQIEIKKNCGVIIFCCIENVSSCWNRTSLSFRIDECSYATMSIILDFADEIEWME